jgi:Uma2 family endonuclease
MPLVTHVVEPPSASLRYAEERGPIVFPESAEVPESEEHQDQRMLLYQMLRDALGEGVTVGTDQFVYLDAEDPTQVLAPDVYVRLTPSTGYVRTWKVWERGAPELAVEIISDSDAPESVWQKKLARYRQLGARELVRFDARDAERPLRIWDRVEGRLLERVVEEARARSLVLGFDWVVRSLERLDRGLRVEQNGVLVPTRAEATEVERLAKEAAEARVRELEAELARR